MLEAPDEHRGAAGGQALVLDGPTDGEHRLLAEHVDGQARVLRPEATEDGRCRRGPALACPGHGRRQRQAAGGVAQDAIDAGDVPHPVAPVPGGEALGDGEAEPPLPRPQPGDADAGAVGDVADGEAEVVVRWCSWSPEQCVADTWTG